MHGIPGAPDHITWTFMSSVLASLHTGTALAFAPGRRVRGGRMTELGESLLVGAVYSLDVNNQTPGYGPGDVYWPWEATARSGRKCRKRVSRLGVNVKNAQSANVKTVRVVNEQPTLTVLTC